MGKIVDVIYPGKVFTASVGPAQIEKNIRSEISKLDLSGLEINLICTDSERSSVENVGLIKNSNVKAFIKDTLYSSNLLYIIIQELRIFLFIIKYLKNRYNKADVVVFHHLSAFYYYNIFSRSTARKVLFQHTNGDPFSMLELKFTISSQSRIFKWVKKKLTGTLHLSDKIVFISEIGYSRFMLNYPLLANKSILLKNGIPYRPMKSKEFLKYGRMNLISVGTLSNRKGQDVIIRALSSMNEEQRERFHLYLVGSGPQERQFKESVLRLGLNKYVTFRGKMDQEEIIEFLDEIDCMILMSYSEGLPISLIEGLRSGIPIVTTNADGCPETVESNGYILDKGDYKALAETLLSMNEADIKKLSAESRKLYENEFDLRKFISKYLSLLRQI